MKRLMKILFLIFSVSPLIAMEPVALGPVKVVSFRNRAGEKIEIPSHIVANSSVLQTAVQNSLLRSIGSGAPKEIYLEDLQNFKQIEECITYADFNSDKLKTEIGLRQVLDNIPHFMDIMDICSKLNLPRVQHAIAKEIGEKLQVSKNRCLAFKNGTFARLHTTPVIANMIAQEIIKPAKYYWLSQVRSCLPEVDQLNAEDQITNFITPYHALLLLDSYENKTKATPLSFAPGEENALFRVFRPLVKPTTQERLAYAWKQLNPVYKWTFAGLGAAALCGTGYAAYRWFGAK